MLINQDAPKITVFSIVSWTVSSTIRNIWLFAGIVLTSAGMLWIYTFLRKLLRIFLVQMIQEGEIPQRFHASLDLAHACLPWIIIFPAIFGFYAASARIVTINNGTAPAVSVFKELFVSIKFATLGMLYAFKIIPYFAVPALAALLVDPIAQHYLTTTPVIMAYYLLLAIIFGWTIHLVTPSIMVPIIGVCVRVLPDSAIHEAYAFHKVFGWKLLWLFAAAIALITLFVYVAKDLHIGMIYLYAMSLIPVYVAVASAAHLYVLFYQMRQQG